MTDNDLLQPSLSRTDAPATSIYSATTGYVAAFLGGPMGGAVVAMVNSWRLKRLGADWPMGLLAVLITATILYWEARMGGEGWLVERLGSGGPRMLLRVAAILYFVGIYALHYKSYRNMALLGIEPPSGWRLGIVGVVVGFAATAGLTALVQP
jgi:hypothetical protein